jgi:hypothetical protein
MLTEAQARWGARPLSAVAGPDGDGRVRGRGVHRASVVANAVGITAAVLAVILVVVLAGPVAVPWPTGAEALCYWFPSLADPYARSDWTAPIAYVYSPAFLQAIAPLKALPWPAFLAAWTAILLVAVRWLSGPRLYALAIALVAFEIAGGNIHLLMAAAVVAGFRWPWTWSFLLLTKVTPGIGLTWFAVRGEWRNLAIALGATAAIVAASYAVSPAAWAEWVDVLVASAGKTTGTWASIGLPLWVRLPAAVALVAWGGRTDRRWTVPVAAMLALPALWFGGFSMLLAVIPLRAGAAARPGEPYSSGSPAAKRAISCV